MDLHRIDDGLGVFENAASIRPRSAGVPASAGQILKRQRSHLIRKPRCCEQANGSGRLRASLGCQNVGLDTRVSLLRFVPSFFFDSAKRTGLVPVGCGFGVLSLERQNVVQRGQAPIGHKLLEANVEANGSGLLNAKEA